MENDNLLPDQYQADLSGIHNPTHIYAILRAQFLP